LGDLLDASDSKYPGRAELPAGEETNVKSNVKRDDGKLHNLGDPDKDPNCFQGKNPYGPCEEEAKKRVPAKRARQHATHEEKLAIRQLVRLIKTV